MVCLWTDSRGEFLDSHIFPFGGLSSRQDTKGIQSLFVQVLQQGCQILQATNSIDNGVVRPRDFVITRIGSFYELEYQVLDHWCCQPLLKFSEKPQSSRLISSIFLTNWCWNQPTKTPFNQQFQQLNGPNLRQDSLS